MEIHTSGRSNVIDRGDSGMLILEDGIQGPSQRNSCDSSDLHKSFCKNNFSIFPTKIDSEKSKISKFLEMPSLGPMLNKDFAYNQNRKRDLLILEKFNEMKPKCNSKYLENRVDKTIGMINNFKKKTSKNSSVHNAFQYIFDKAKGKKLDLLAQKNSDLSWLNMADVELENNLDVN